MGVIRAIGGLEMFLLAWFCLHTVFKIMLTNEGGKLFFKKSDTKLEEGGVWSMKSMKKTADCIRNSQNCKCYAYCGSCKRGLEAKTARESSHRLFLKGARSEHIANRTSNRATRASKHDKIVCFLSRLGVKKVRCLIESTRRRFSKLCFPPWREALFWKHVVRKVS